MKQSEAIDAARTIERWCNEHSKSDGPCKCPFYDNAYDCMLILWTPKYWEIDETMREVRRGRKS